MLNSLQIIFIN